MIDFIFSEDFQSVLALSFRLYSSPAAAVCFLYPGVFKQRFNPGMLPESIGAGTISRPIST
jgi:hypothetical protein